MYPHRYEALTTKKNVVKDNYVYICQTTDFFNGNVCKHDC